MRLTENSLFTADGQMVGTPAYMSPEQASMSRLDVDTRSDVYSLGVLLYELLTGTTPIETTRLRDAGYSEIGRLIREVEPPRPSTRLSALGESATLVAGNRATDPRRLCRLLSGDLDWIVMKALEKDPNRRYSVAGKLRRRRRALLAGRGHPGPAAVDSISDREVRGAAPGGRGGCCGPSVPKTRSRFGPRTTWRSCWPCKACSKTRSKLAKETLEIQRRVEGPESITTLRRCTTWRSCDATSGGGPRLGLCLTSHSRRSARLRPRPPGYAPGGQRPGRALARPAPAGRGPGALRGGPEGAAECPRPDERRDGPDDDQPRRHRTPPGPPRRVRKLAEEADALNQRTLGPEHPQTLFGLTILSSVARDQGSLDEAAKGYEKALAVLRRTLSARTPEVQRCMADYAWMLAATADPGYHDPHRAIELASELIKNSPKVRDVWTTLGVAHYRAGDWNDAIAALEKSEAAAPGLFTAANGFFLAMAYYRLGEKEKGRQWYSKALQSVETASQPTKRELELFRLEASHLMIER